MFRFLIIPSSHSNVLHSTQSENEPPMQQFLQRWLNMGNDVRSVVTSRHYTMPSLRRRGYWRGIIPPCSPAVPSYFRRGSGWSGMRKVCPVCGRLGCGRICRSHLPDHVVKSNKDDHSNAECWRRPDREIDGIELVSEAFNIGFHWFPPGELSGIETVWRTDHPLPSEA